MTEEPARKPCCIEGCRRTWKDEGPGEVMCGRHYRADPELYLAHKDIRRRCRRVLTILNRYYSSNRRTERECEAVYQRMAARQHAAWVAIKANSQMLQNTGYWARLPRTRPTKEDTRRGKPKLAQGFDAEFQRLKRQMDEGRRSRT